MGGLNRLPLQMTRRANMNKTESLPVGDLITRSFPNSPVHAAFLEQFLEIFLTTSMALGR